MTINSFYDRQVKQPNILVYVCLYLRSVPSSPFLSFICFSSISLIFLKMKKGGQQSIVITNKYYLPTLNGPSLHRTSRSVVLDRYDLHATLLALWLLYPGVRLSFPYSCNRAMKFRHSLETAYDYIAHSRSNMEVSALLSQYIRGHVCPEVRTGCL